MWFTVSLLFEALNVTHPDKEGHWEEQIRLVKADSETAARQEGERIGREDEHEYITATGDLLKWKFRQIERVYQILAETLDSRTEVFSRFLRRSEVQALLAPFDDDT